VGSDAIPHFVRLLSSPVDLVREQAVWALGNIAGDSPACRDQVLRAGALPAMLAQLNVNTKPGMRRWSYRTLSLLCRGKPQPPFELVKSALPTLAALINSQVCPPAKPRIPWPDLLAPALIALRTDFVVF
jgi:importin subunit alpha-1